MTGIARIAPEADVKKMRSLGHGPPHPEKRGKLNGVVIKWPRLADILNMSSIMTAESENLEELLRRVRDGDAQALVALFSRYRDRLKRMVRLRLDRRLQGRVDPSDVLQEAYRDGAGRAGARVHEPTGPG